MSLISKIDTKKEAFRLVHDPVKLLSLLYLKYGDIEEEYYLFWANQLIYNTSSHYNSLFKEFQLNISKDEYLKRYYKKYETTERIPMLSDYYKNYHIFFCKPVLRNFASYELLHTHEELKAEIFYKKNYEDEISTKKIDNKDEKENESSSLSSLDNITNNKIIFSKRCKNIIDNDLDEKMNTITLNSESARNKINSSENNFGLISKRNLNDSFEKIVKNLVEYQFNKNKKIKEKKNKNNKKYLLFRPNNGYYTSKYFNKKKKKINTQNSYKHIYNHLNKIKISLNTISRKTFSYKNSHIKNIIKKPKSQSKSHSIKNIFYSTNIEKNNFYKISSKIEGKSLKKINIKLNDQEKNKTMKITNFKTINNKKSKNNNIAIYNFNNNLFNMNTNYRVTNYKNFSKLSAILNKNKKKTNSNSTSQKLFNTIQHKKILHNQNLKEFLTINNEQNNVKTFYINNNRKKNNKTFDFNLTSNTNNKKEASNNNRTINITKNHRNKTIYGGSKVN